MIKLLKLVLSFVQIMPKRRASKPSKPTLKKTRLTLTEARKRILDSDSSSDNLDDVETESDSEMDVHAADSDADSPAASTSVRGAVGGWTKRVKLIDSTFQPREPPGPRSGASHCSANTTVLEYFSLFWGDDMWQLIVDNTNLNANHVIATKPNDYYATLWKPLTIPELKAFVGLRLAMEYAVIKRRYEHYFSSKIGFIFHTPGFREVMSRDRYLAVWKFLHEADENDPSIDKQDKLSLL